MVIWTDKILDDSLAVGKCIFKANSAQENIYDGAFFAKVIKGF